MMFGLTKGWTLRNVTTSKRWENLGIMCHPCTLLLKNLLHSDKHVTMHKYNAITVKSFLFIRHLILLCFFVGRAIHTFESPPKYLFRLDILCIV